MNYLDCNIVKDLIPSYLENLCSESSKNAVEAHLAKCNACRSYVETLQSTEVTADASNQYELDYMKKVKQHYTKKNALGIVLMLILSQITLWILPQLHNFKNEIILYCVIFSILALGTFLLLTNYQAKPKMNKGRAGAGVLSALGIPCCLLIRFLIIRATVDGIIPFGMSLNETGPFFNGLLILIVIGELVLFGYYALDAVRSAHMLGLLPTLNLMCCTLCMSYRSLLFVMYVPNRGEFIRLDVIVLILSIVIVSAELLLTKLHTAWSKKYPMNP